MKAAISGTAILPLAACAVTPENISEANNARLCGAWERNPKAEYIQKEIEARKIDCTAYLSLMAQRQNAAAAAQSNYWNTYNAVTRPYAH